MLTLNTIRAQPGMTHRKKRLGRGPGSGKGGTSGKGHKGQLARSGGHVIPGFEGGQTPLFRRLPKRGFKNFFRKDWFILNLGDCARVFEKAPEKTVSLDTLRTLGAVGKTETRLAILGNGELSGSWKFKAHRVTQSAVQKIEKAGGTLELLPPPAKYIRKKKQGK